MWFPVSNCKGLGKNIDNVLHALKHEGQTHCNCAGTLSSLKTKAKPQLTVGCKWGSSVRMEKEKMKSLICSSHESPYNYFQNLFSSICLPKDLKLFCRLKKPHQPTIFLTSYIRELWIPQVNFRGGLDQLFSPVLLFYWPMMFGSLSM